jgi:amino acid transporter
VAQQGIRSGDVPVQPGVGLDYDVARIAGVDKLHARAVGLPGVLFLVLTGSAPIAAMLYNVPVQVGFGEGRYAPASYVVATLILLVFSVGYAAMARKVTAAGGFYSYISHGLGREVGMAMGCTAVMAYSVFEAALAGGFAYFTTLKLSEFGISIAWPWLALAMVLVISILTYFDVRLSAIVLGVGLVTEVLIMLVFDAGIFGHAGAGAHVDATVLNPINAFAGFAAHAHLTAGVAGIGLFFAFWSYVGFEMAPNYGEESRNPKRIVPLSLYISVLGLGVFYTVTSWAAVSGYPSADAAIRQAQTHSDLFFSAPARRFAGAWVWELISYLILTSSFACAMAFHNTAARYFYALGREGLLWSRLGKTHATYRSPYVASITQTCIAALIVVLFAVFAGSNDASTQAYLELFGLMSILGVIAILAAQALVSVAILVYFERSHPNDVRWWNTRIAPVIAFVSQVVVLYLLLSQIQFFGTGYGLANWLAPIVLVIFLLGLGGAFYLKAKDPAKYEKIGRLIYEGV